jgi:hypothetical protein
MLAYRIVCAKHQLVGQTESHRHVVQIGTGDDSGFARKWSIDQALEAMKEGDVFYTQDQVSGKITPVTAYHCVECNCMQIRSAPYAPTGSNLDDVPDCSTL